MKDPRDKLWRLLDRPETVHLSDQRAYLLDQRSAASAPGAVGGERSRLLAGKYAVEEIAQPVFR